MNQLQDEMLDWMSDDQLSDYTQDQQAQDNQPTPQLWGTSPLCCDCLNNDGEAISMLAIASTFECPRCGRIE